MRFITAFKLNTDISGTLNESNRLRYGYWTLMLSLRSISTFFNGPIELTVIADGVPDWLDETKCTIISQREYCPLNQLNSNAVESRIFLTESQSFAYFNDDFFFGKPCGKEVFFDSDAPVHYLKTRPNIHGKFLKSCNYTRAVLEKRIAGYKSCKELDAHGICYYSAEQLQWLREHFRDELKRTAASPFRADNDFNRCALPEAFVHAGLAVRRDGAASVEMRSLGNPIQWDKTFVCVNDDNGELEAGFQATMKLFQKFPKKSIWEKS
ncbi:hypothetical protein FACS1894214_4470 [Planctomycetales bacterium]|nr:hypothetical protein FACS1894214_4470 [Planctomycetales bacterium]